MDGSGRKFFAADGCVMAGLERGVDFASLLIEGIFWIRFEIGDNLLWLRLFEVQAFEVRGRDLERVEQEAGGFPFESFLQDHLHDLANDGLNGVRIFKNGQNDFAGCVLFGIVVTVHSHGTILLMVETEIPAAESGGTALGSIDLDMTTTGCG
jgi:hypothetical protein